MNEASTSLTLLRPLMCLRQSWRSWGDSRSHCVHGGLIYRLHSLQWCSTPFFVIPSLTSSLVFKQLKQVLASLGSIIVPHMQHLILLTAIYSFEISIYSPLIILKSLPRVDVLIGIEVSIPLSRFMLARVVLISSFCASISIGPVGCVGVNKTLSLF